MSGAAEEEGRKVAMNWKKNVEENFEFEEKQHAELLFISFYFVSFLQKVKISKFFMNFSLIFTSLLSLSLHFHRL